MEKPKTLNEEAANLRKAIEDLKGEIRKAIAPMPLRAFVWLCVSGMLAMDILIRLLW